MPPNIHFLMPILLFVHNVGGTVGPQNYADEQVKIPALDLPSEEAYRPHTQ